MKEISVACNYDSGYPKRLNAVIKYINPDVSGHKESPKENKTFVFLDIFGVRNRGLTQLRDIMSPFTKRCANNPSANPFKKNTNYVGAIVFANMNAMTSNPVHNAAYSKLSIDERVWIRHNFLNPQDYAVRKNNVHYADNPEYIEADDHTNAELSNHLMFHSFDKQGIYCVGRIFCLETLEAAVTAAKGGTVEAPYTKEFLADYLNCFKNAIEHPFVPLENPSWIDILEKNVEAGLMSDYSIVDDEKISATDLTRLAALAPKLQLVESLRFRRNKLNSENLNTLLNLVPSFENLQELDLSGTQFTSKNIDVLNDVLKKSKIKYLILQDCTLNQGAIEKLKTANPSVVIFTTQKRTPEYWNSTTTPREKALRDVRFQLENIYKKGKELYDKGEPAAAYKAWGMHGMIQKECMKYEKDPNYSLDNFKNNCNEAMNEAQGELKKHRGWRKILYNLGIAVLTVCLAHLIVGTYNAASGKEFFFNPSSATDSMKKLKELKEQINNLTDGSEPDDNDDDDNPNKLTNN